MDETFIERRFEIGGKAVVLRFMRPERDGDDCYRCHYRITWPDRERNFFGFGVDEVQALYVAMHNAHADLLASPEGRAGLLTWLGQQDLGLPLAGSVTPDDFRRST